MGVNESVIRFAFPKNCSLFSSLEKLETEPYCLCYQYDINKGYGPYGFHTKAAEVIIERIQETYIFWDAIQEKVSPRVIFSKHCIGIHRDIFDELYADYTQYTLQAKKNFLLLRLNKKTQSITSPKPLLLDLFDTANNVLNSDAVNLLLLQGYDLISNCFFTPQAGDVIVAFTPSTIRVVKDVSEKQNISYMEVSEIDDLPMW